VYAVPQGDAGPGAAREPARRVRLRGRGALARQEGHAAAAAFHKALGLNALEPYADTTRQAVYLLGPRGLPTTLLIDAEGREVARALGAREWDNPAVVSEIVQRLELD
jgi:hypothetical protein